MMSEPMYKLLILAASLGIALGLFGLFGVAKISAELLENENGGRVKS